MDFHDSKYENLSVMIIMNPLKRGRNGGLPYKYLITERATSYTAFYTKTAFKRWIRERGLRLGKRMGWRGLYKIEGGFISRSWLNEEYFSMMAIRFPKTRVMSNGDYTQGVITSEHGIFVVNYLNPNCKREVYDYKESQAIYG